jgi:hypothetical protein
VKSDMIKYHPIKFIQKHMFRIEGSLVKKSYALILDVNLQRLANNFIIAVIYLGINGTLVEACRFNFHPILRCFGPKPAQTSGINWF